MNKTNRKRKAKKVAKALRELATEIEEHSYARKLHIIEDYDPSKLGHIVSVEASAFIPDDK